MSCACENRKLGQEYDRIHRLAKALAKLEDCLVAIYQRPDGTYGFTAEPSAINEPIVEYITQYE